MVDRYVAEYRRLQAIELAEMEKADARATIKARQIAEKYGYPLEVEQAIYKALYESYLIFNKEYQKVAEEMKTIYDGLALWLTEEELKELTTYAPC